MSEKTDLPAFAHGGDLWAEAAAAGVAPEAVLDFSANIHPWGPPPRALEAARAALDRVQHYPSPQGEPLRSALSARLGWPVVLGNGATELLREALVGARRVWLRAPSYLGYEELACNIVLHDNDPRPEPGDAVVVGRPNNPDGHLPSPEEVAALARPGVKVIVDESFLAFTDAPSCLGTPGLTVVSSLTKTYGIPGLRLGWAWPAEGLRLPPWTVNGPALAAGLALLEDWDWPRRAPLGAWRQALAAALGALPGVKGVGGAANFLLLELEEPRGPELRKNLLVRHGVLVRDASNFKSLNKRHLRVAVRIPAENQRLVAAMGQALGGGP